MLSFPFPTTWIIQKIQMATPHSMATLVGDTIYSSSRNVATKSYGDRTCPTGLIYLVLMESPFWDADAMIPQERR